MLCTAEIYSSHSVARFEKDYPLTIDPLLPSTGPAGTINNFQYNKQVWTLAELASLRTESRHK